MKLQPVAPDFASVNRAFTKQSGHFDEEDIANIILADMRAQIYAHVDGYLQPRSTILELNAGTGIDAIHFAQQGHAVHATDLSDGMIAQLRQKVERFSTLSITCQQLSYANLDALGDRKFDYVFSNFGGLNCIDDLTKVTRHLPMLLKPGSYVTWVIMPPVCLWEIAGVLKGRFQSSFRRFAKDGVMAHLEGEYFKTYYFSLQQIKSAFGKDFSLVKTEGLGVAIPQPHRPDFPVRNPSLYNFLKRIDRSLRNSFPFNRCADHIIVTFQRN
jgi:ubiquinone/menaquinone biosynthesis C-methylase UbiE